MSAEPPTQPNEVGKKKDSARKSSPGRNSLMLLFSATIFISAALLFLVQPMFAKFILPLFGSTPAVWTGSMMFFQAALLVGYLYVHATTTWLGARRQAVLHLAVVLLPILLFIFAGPLSKPGSEWAPTTEGTPIFLLLGLLLVSVGLPFFAISTTNPLIQRWLADTDHPSAKDPYFLYRASNLGSIIGLLGYPLLVERELTLTNQGLWWTMGYGVLVILVLVSAVMLWRSNPAPAHEEEAEEPLAGDPVSGGGSPQSVDPSLGTTSPAGLSVWRRLRWVGLAFVPSSLMLGVTAFITTDITPIPLLWVIPLSLYLFSFVIVFSPSQRMPEVLHKLSVAALPLVMAALVVTVLTDLKNPYWALIGLNLFGFFVVAMVLHGEVARDRPPARHLTEFYLWVAVGGVLGGIFNAVIAPIAFDTVVEYPLMIVLACLFLPGVLLARVMRSEPSGREEETGQSGEQGEGRRGAARFVPLLLDLVLPLALGLVIVALAWAATSIEAVDTRDTVEKLLIGLAIAVCLYFAYFSNRAVRFGLGVAAVIVAATFTIGATDAFYKERSFFGVYKVTGTQGTENAYHTLTVGETNHGAQFLGPQPPVPTTYYHQTGPIGQAFQALPEETTSRVAALGLGTGSLACYNKPGQQWEFYEIDPLIQKIASDENLFTYLSDCPGQSDVVLGDARLRLAEAPSGEYSMVVGDAFSSDAIPVHLLTREALDMYLDKLNENGVVAMHISNRHLDLEPVLGNLAQDAGLVCRNQFDEDTSQVGKFASHWVLMARNEGDLGDITYDSRWRSCATDPSMSVWTDDFSNLLSTFDWE